MFWKFFFGDTPFSNTCPIFFHNFLFFFEKFLGLKSMFSHSVCFKSKKQNSNQVDLSNVRLKTYCELSVAVLVARVQLRLAFTYMEGCH